MEANKSTKMKEKLQNSLLKPKLFSEAETASGRTMGVLHSNSPCSAWMSILYLPFLTYSPGGQGLHCKQGSPWGNTKGWNAWPAINSYVRNILKTLETDSHASRLLIFLAEIQNPLHCSILYHLLLCSLYYIDFSICNN